MNPTLLQLVDKFGRLRNNERAVDAWVTSNSTLHITYEFTDSNPVVRGHKIVRMHPAD